MDLSKVLGDVYAGSSAPTGGTTVPEWADDAHLDEAFASWTPGPPPEAPAAEREMASHDDPRARRRIDDDLAAALTEALTAQTSSTESAFADLHTQESDDIVGELFAEPIPEPVPVRAWTRGDDDVLPVRSSGGRRGLNLRFGRR